MMREFQKELTRQRGFQGEAYTAFNQQLPMMGSEYAGTEMAKGQANREAAYAKAGATPLTIGHSMFSPNAVDQASAGMRGEARAKLGAYGDWRQQAGINSAHFQDTLNRISNFSQGWQQVEPYRMYDAQHSNDELAFWGQLIASIGGSSMNLAQSFGSNPPQSAWGGVTPSQYLGPSIQQGYDMDPSLMASIGGYV